MTVEAGSVWADPGYTAIDAFEGNVTSLVQVTPLSFSTQVPSNTRIVVTYAARDLSMNMATKTRNVTVLDRMPPLISLLGPASDTVEFATTYQDPGVVYNDSAVTLPLNYTRTGVPVNTTTLGLRTIVYRVVDTGGNAAQVSRNVTVVDTTEPVITLVGAASVYVELGQRYNESGATAFDAYSKNLTSNITISRPANLLGVTSIVGQYVVNYTVADSSGNIARAYRNVIVQDSSAPTITLSGLLQLVWPAGQAFVEPGYSAFDAGE